MNLKEIRNDDSLIVVMEANEKVREQFYWLASEVERLEKALAHTEQLWREEREKNK